MKTTLALLEEFNRSVPAEGQPLLCPEVGMMSDTGEPAIRFQYDYWNYGGRIDPFVQALQACGLAKVYLDFLSAFVCERGWSYPEDLA